MGKEYKKITKVHTQISQTLIEVLDKELDRMLEFEKNKKSGKKKNKWTRLEISHRLGEELKGKRYDE